MATEVFGGMGGVNGPTSSTDKDLASFSGTDGQTIQDSGIPGVSSAASKLLGRGSASGAGAWQEVALGTGLSMSGTTLNASGTVAGSTTQVQYNNAGAFGASSNLTVTFDGSGNATFNVKGDSNTAGPRLNLYDANGSVNVRLSNILGRFYVQNDTVGDMFDVQTNGTMTVGPGSTGADLKSRHLLGFGSAPSIAGNGTLNTGSMDIAGKVTSTATSASTIVLTFGTGFARAPAAWAVNETTNTIARVVSTTTTLSILCAGMQTGDVISYGVLGF